MDYDFGQDYARSGSTRKEIYGSYLQTMKPLFAGKTYRKTLETQEGWAAVEDAICSGPAGD